MPCSAYVAVCSLHTGRCKHEEHNYGSAESLPRALEEAAQAGGAGSVGPRGLPLGAQREPSGGPAGALRGVGAGLRSQGRKPGRKGPGGDGGCLPRAGNGARLGVRLLFWKPVWTAVIGPRAHRGWARAGALGRVPGRAPTPQEGRDPRIVPEPAPGVPDAHPPAPTPPCRPLPPCLRSEVWLSCERQS